MNIEEVARRIENPNLMSVQDADAIQQLIDRYPYAQTFPLLLLTALGRNGDLRFDDELNKYAYRIADRMRLYELVHTTQEFTGECNIIEDEKTEEQAPLIVEENKIPISAEVLKSEEPTSSTVEEEGLVEIDSPVFDEKIEIESPSEIEKLEQEPTIRENVVREDFETADQSNDQLNVEVKIEQEAEKNVFDSINHLEVKISEIVSNHDHDADNFTSEALAQSFHLTLSDETPNEEPGITLQEKVEVVPVSTSELRSFSEWLNSPTSAKITDEKSALKPAQDIIDRFIEEEPKITRLKNSSEEEVPKKTPFFNPLEKAKKSIEENELPISETLAKIFAAQGHYPKAIEVYKELSLLIPEKKIFFANQIEKLEQKSNR